ncbi:LPS assembly protein LptD [Acetobacteraceae bacterium KSS8]|uniref:LPS-assembly protein LptD n=1 Tax=Endosaccharibacter trunci TaxID=2812733 RepID=A0ABT1W5J1_9PROT|nr:LPS assembly protein LptD [Acetobacteraceae bacterium KSS8]
MRRRTVAPSARTIPAPPAPACPTLSRRRRLLCAGLYGLSLAGLPFEIARAQIALPSEGHGGAPMQRNEPVTFRADSVSYDSKAGIVTWTGHVEIWQNDHAIRADRVTYDRNSGVAAASGHVAIVEPDGQVLFSDYAELTQGMRQAVMTDMRGIMAMNGKMAANGARRTDGKVNDLSRVVYTACKVCAEHPEHPPFWQIRAYDATDDLEHKRIEYRDVYLDMFGLPVGYLPFFSTPDPSVKRQSGFLLGDISPHDKYLGTYVTVPYFWAIDRESDVTFVPLLSTNTGPQLTAQYRHNFNSGVLRVTGAVAYDTNKTGAYTATNGNQVAAVDDKGVQGYMFAKAQFDWNQYWRYGADVNLASSANYMRDYRITGYGADVLSSDAYIEGFGTGAYSRIDGTAFQGLNAGVINQSELPFVLPRYQYYFTGTPDALGGRFSLGTSDFNIYRANGTSDQRGQLSLNWDRPFHDRWGQIFVFTAHLDSSAYKATKLDLLPNYAGVNAASTAQALPTAALKMNWPFLKSMRNSSVILEPIVQLIAAPNYGNSRNRNIPNEDSLDYEFTDSTLFNINRHEGVDRLDGGLRANYGLHANWTFGSRQVDALVGESLQEHIDRNQLPDTGLQTHASDIVARLRFTPVRYLDFTVRDRFDHNTGRTNFADGLFSAGVPLFSVTGGYIYNRHSFYYYYNNNIYTSAPPQAYLIPTNEGTIGLSSTWKQWHVAGYTRRDLSNNRFVAIGTDASYTNDCFIFDVAFNRRYTTINGDSGDTSILFTLTFKTLGTFPVNG